MYLWNDYEGKTIAEAYPIGKLIRPEGRSAFFTTSNGTGTPAVLRLTESLNDETEMVERWRRVAEIHQEHLVQIKSFGQTVFDGTPLAYALMELTDASLSDVLRQRSLTVAETKEIARSLVAALLALHDQGLVHEHVNAESVLGAGDVIKLRSDCVRDCTDDLDYTAEELKRRDVQALATLLLRCLTLDERYTVAVGLPAPFDRLIPRGLNGTWGLADMDTALTPPAASVTKPLVPEGVLSSGQRATVEVPVKTAASARLQLVSPPVSKTRRPVSPRVLMDEDRVRNRVVEPMPHGPRFWLGLAAVAVAFVCLVMYLVHGGTTSANASAATPVSTVAPIKTIDDAPAPKVAVAGVATLETQAGWHVVAYTYKNAEQAWHMVGSIRDRHPSLRPEVFSPNGHAPFLVTLGGAMSKDEAEALRKTARKDGMPKDTFVRDYRRA
jgi:hypothetical protein